MKIAVIGYSGAGKSTLARKLGDALNADVLHLDTVQFLPGWKDRPKEEKQQIVTEFLDSHTAWVIDGTYSSLSFDRRMDEADLIIEMLFGRLACLRAVCERYRKYRHTTRPDMTEGCEEKLDATFVRWVLFDGRTRKAAARFHRVRGTYPEKTVVLKNRRAAEKFLRDKFPKMISD